MSDAEFSQLWSTFYDRAVTVSESTATAAENSTTPMPRPSSPHKEEVIATLDGLTKIVFGLGAFRKAAIVSHGDGALELIVSLTRGACVLDGGNFKARGEGSLDATVLTSAFKAAKVCVVRNPAGRSRVRSAGIFALTDEALRDNENVALVEEILTTLAAACLGDDLNALQASVQLRHHIDRAATLEGDGTEGLKQKVTYLKALFVAITKEHSSLLESIVDSHRSFFDSITAAEIDLRRGNKAALEEKFEMAALHYNRALDKVAADKFATDTKLLESLRCQVYWNRANVRLKLGKEEEALNDTDMLLKMEIPPDIAGSLQRFRAKAFSALGRNEEAKEAAGKALMINPQDEELRGKMADQKLG